MIDTRRWVLVEAWLALGLRLSWALPYEARELGADDIFEDDETRAKYYHRGHGEWCVLEPPSNIRNLGYPAFNTPQLGASTLAHELAHYLTASKEQRGERNFGLKPGDDDAERRALLAESVLDAMCQASGRIAALAMQVPRGVAPP